MRNADDSLACLQENGYRVTTTREAVNKGLYRLKGPFTIEELADSLPGIGRATAFRTVRLFQDLGFSLSCMNGPGTCTSFSDNCKVCQ